MRSYWWIIRLIRYTGGRTGSDRSVSYTVGGLRSGIGTNVAEKSKGNIYLFIYTEKDDTVIMKISRRTERLHSPSCGIFVFESLADEFTESDWITFNAEQMPSFCVSSLFRFNIESLTLEIACQTLIGDRK